MLILLPFLALLFLYFNISSHKVKQTFLLRETLIISLVSWCIILVLITESANLFHLVNAAALSFCWGAFDLALLAVFFSKKQKIIFPAKFSTPELDLESKIMLSTVGAILVATFILAITVAPNNIDAMSYHLGRVMYWIQNSSINFYPTNISWQTNNGQLASFIQLHFYLLSGGDRFANLVQWLFFVGNIIAASLIAKSLKADSKTQIASSFFLATIPMAILQASTTHDVIVISFFILSFIYFSFRFLSSNEKKFVYFAGASLGLGLFTKQIAYIYSFPFFVWVLFLFIQKFKAKKALLYIILVSAVAIVINLGFYLRNIELFHLPIYSIRNDYINSPLGLSALLSNVIKNIGVHLSTPSQAINYKIHTALSSLFKLLHVAENSPGLNWVNFPFGIPPFIASEYSAPATIHLVLGTIASFLLFTRHKGKTMLKIYFLCIMAGFLIFSGVFKWQPGASHLENEVFVLFTPLIAIVFAGWNKIIRYAVLIILILSSIYFVFFNIYKPVISEEPIFKLPRMQQYFKYEPELYQPYLRIGKFVQKGGYQKVGVIFTEYYSEMEYPLWVVLKAQSPNIQIEQVAVENPTAKIDHQFKPDVVIFLGTNRSALKQYVDQKIPVIGLK